MPHRGFTLIEILVVLTIMGIILGMATLSFGDFGAHQRLQAEAEETLHFLEMIQQQAAITSTTYGVACEHQDCRVFMLNALQQWQKASSTFLPHSPHLSHTTYFKDHHPHKDPAIIFYTTGEPNHFTLSLETSDLLQQASITSTSSGTLHLTYPMAHHA